MSFKLPLFRQQKPKTCALACLRMVLAAHGTNVEESVLESQAHMEPEGTPIGEVERLARLYGLAAEIQETTVADLRRILAEGSFPIAYIDRAIFDLTPRQRSQHRLRAAKMHVVVTVGVTDTSVVFHDPLSPRVVRKPVRVFRQAFERLGGCCVICSLKKNA
jgi:ABC-type bacteriocin/lantibiotic exporter with double-glycine peptidase domain